MFCYKMINHMYYYYYSIIFLFTIQDLTTSWQPLSSSSSEAITTTTTTKKNNNWTVNSFSSQMIMINNNNNNSTIDEDDHYNLMMDKHKFSKRSRSSLGQSCKENSQCHEALAVCTDYGKCECPIGFFINKITYNLCMPALCNEDKDCNHLFVSKHSKIPLVCRKNLCTCPDDMNLSTDKARCIPKNFGAWLKYLPLWVWITFSVLIILVIICCITYCYCCCGCCRGCSSCSHRRGGHHHSRSGRGRSSSRKSKKSKY